MDKQESLPALYKIADEFNRIDELLAAAPDQGLVDYFKAEQNDVMELLTKKVDATVEYLNREEDLIALAKKRVDELRAFIDAKEKKIERLKNYVLFCMQQLKKDRLQGELASIRTRAPSKSVDVYNDEVIPGEYLKAEIKVDKKKLRADLLAGKDIPGAQLIDGKVSLTFGLRRINERVNDDDKTRISETIE